MERGDRGCEEGWKDKRMEGEDRVRWRMERQERGMEDGGEGKDQWRRGRMGGKERIQDGEQGVV